MSDPSENSRSTGADDGRVQCGVWTLHCGWAWLTQVPQASQALNSDLSNIANTEPLHKLEIDDSGTGTNDIKFKKIALK